MQDTDAHLLRVLQALEAELHAPAARGDAGKLNALLHDEFREFGRSGTAYNKRGTLARLPAQAQHDVVAADQFEVQPLAERVALLTYRSAHRCADGSLERFTLRSSVWELTEQGWQMRFHQGTPTQPWAAEPHQLEA